MKKSKGDYNDYIKISLFAVISTLVFYLLVHFFLNTSSSSQSELEKQISQSDNKVLKLKNDIIKKDNIIDDYESEIKACQTELNEVNNELNLYKESLSPINSIDNDSVSPVILRNELDLLGKEEQRLLGALTKEIAGSNGGSSGYGPKAREIEKKLVSVKERIEEIKEKLEQ